MRDSFDFGFWNSDCGLKNLTAGSFEISFWNAELVEYGMQNSDCLSAVRHVDELM